MADPARASVLSRMIAAQRRAPAPADRGVEAGRALGRAIRRAGAAFDGLAPEPATCEASWNLDLPGAVQGLPEAGLLAALEGEEGARALLCLDPAFVDALIEVQTTGRVDSLQGPPRRVTKIDEALTRDFIDLFLSAFAAELAQISGVDWPARLRFGGVIADRRQISLLMPDGVFHALSMPTVFADGAKTGRLALALPQIASKAAPGARAGQPASGKHDPAWEAALRRAVDRAPVTLDAVLLRLTRSLAEVETLQPGDLIPFDPEDLAAIRLEDARGRLVLRARLGQRGGRRAVRIGGAGEEDLAAPTAAAPADPPPQGLPDPAPQAPAPAPTPASAPASASTTAPAAPPAAAPGPHRDAAVAAPHGPAPAAARG